MMKLSAKSKLFRGLTQALAALLVLCIGITMIAGEWASYINDALGTKSYEFVTSEGGGEDTLYYKSKYSTPEQLIEAREELIRRTVAEGAVLLKNENNGLPLNKTAKVTLFGIATYHSNFSATSGGASWDNSIATKMPDAFNEIGLQTNPVVNAFYAEKGEEKYESGTDRNGNPTYTYVYKNAKTSLGEVPVSLFTDEMKASYSQYNDAAIVVFSRMTGEGSDFTPDPLAVENGGDGVNPILALSGNERDLLEEAKANFDKVIVYVNTDNMIELGELKNDPEIDAIIWSGGLGITGAYGIGDILVGNVSPSGSLVDTILYSNESTPAAVNYGDFSFNTDQLEGKNYTHYVVYAEGIYAGYKYYETRYEDAVMGKGNATSTKGSTNGDAWNYSNEVAYPFGYGLSYTTFSQEIQSVNVDLNNRTAEVTVKVTNTGNVAGKKTVQVYVQTPYTDYDKANNVEKASIQLAGYGKTKTLDPNESETVTVSINLRYVASYDYTNAKTYIMDAGTYYFAVGNGAHEALNNVLAAKGYTTANGMDANGNAALAKTWELNELTKISESETGYTVTNQFDDADLNYWLPDTVTYLSRSDWDATWPKAYVDLTPTAKMIEIIQSDRGHDANYKQDTSITLDNMVTDANTNYTLMMLYDVREDYDNELWDDLLDQMSFEDYVYCIYTLYPAVESIAMPSAPNSDSPSGLNAGFNTDSSRPYYINADTASDKIKTYKFNTYPTCATRAASFDDKLAEEIGTMMGEDGLWSNKAGMTGPGCNMHRTAYGGRNNEYYSEDSVIAALFCAAEVDAMAKMGLSGGPKHFAFNDQELNRQGLCVFFNEQSAREITLRAFQGPYAYAKPTYGMSSFARVGLVSSTASKALLTTVLRDEWGWKGFTMTDMAQGYMPVASSVIVGTDQWCAFSNKNYLEYLNTDTLTANPELAWACREAAHRVMYFALNTNAINGLSKDAQIVSVTPWWQATLYGVSVAVGALTVLCMAMYVMNVNKEKKAV